MPEGLQSLAQADFSSGFWRAVARHLIPANGAYTLTNCLLDEDGSAYRRGGSEYLSTDALGSAGLRLIYDWISDVAGVGQRTLIANGADFGVLSAAEASLNIGGAGVSGPRKPVDLNGIVFVDGQLYGGSRKTANYSAGTVTTNGTTTVTGATTDWDPNADAGMLFRISGERAYVVASVNSDTSITLRDAYQGADGAGKSYTLSMLSTATSPYRSSTMYAVAAKRLFSLEGSRAYFSAPDNPHSFATDDYHEFDQPLIGGWGVGDRLLVFTTRGVQMISGLPFDLTDDFGNVQHRVEKVGEQVLLNQEGIADWQNALVVPCSDGIWLLDGISTPVLLSRSIMLLWREYVAAGYKAGQACVFWSHYFLPIVNASNVVQDLLVCRLDRPVSVRGFGLVFPWTRWADFTGDVAGLSVRTGGVASVRNPALLAASTATGSRVLKLNSCFGPTVGQKNEPDGTTHEWDQISRDYPTGNGRDVNTVRRLRGRYELVDAATDDPTISAFWSDGSVDLSGVSLWDSMDWGDDWAAEDDGEWRQLAGQAPEDDGRTPFSWAVNKQVRFIRFRLQSSSPTTKLALRTVEMFVSPDNKE